MQITHMNSILNWWRPELTITATGAVDTQGGNWTTLGRLRRKAEEAGDRTKYRWR